MLNNLKKYSINLGGRQEMIENKLTIFKEFVDSTFPFVTSIQWNSTLNSY